MKLTDEQLTEVEDEMVSNGIPCRFQINGQTLDIETRELQPKGINVIRQIHYWGFTRETANKIANWLNCKVVFSK